MEAKDKLVGVLVGLARATEGKTVSPSTFALIAKSLRALCLCDMGSCGKEKIVQCKDGAVQDKIIFEKDILLLVEEVRAEKNRLVPDCASCKNPCGHNDDYDASKIEQSCPQVCSAKKELLSVAEETVLIFDNNMAEKVAGNLLCKALFVLGEDWQAAEIAGVTKELRALRQNS